MATKEGASDPLPEEEDESTKEAQTSTQTVEEAVESNWENFSRWIKAICVVTFDLELGQAMEVFSPLSPR